MPQGADFSELTTGQLYYKKHKKEIKGLKSKWQKENKERVKLYQWRWLSKQHLKRPWYGRKKEIPFRGIDRFVPSEEISKYPDSICGYYSPDNRDWQEVCTGEFFIPIHEWTIDS